MDSNLPSIKTAPKNLDDYLYKKALSGGEAINLTQKKKEMTGNDFAKYYQSLEDEFRASELHKKYLAVDNDGVMWAISNPIVRTMKVVHGLPTVIHRKKKIGLVLDEVKPNKKAKF